MIKGLFLTFAALLGLVLIAVAIAFVPRLPGPPDNGLSGDFLIRNVTIIQVDAEPARAMQTVIVRQGRIAAILPYDKIPSESTLTVIDGSGKFLIPGLWDMHTHSTKLSSQYQHPLFLANGVTAVRDMWGCMSEPDSFIACVEDRKRWNEAIANGIGLSPRYIGQSSFQVNDGAEVPQDYPEFFKARNKKEQQKLLGFYSSSGVDILKTYSELPPDTYSALAREARLHGLHLAGHRPLQVSLEEILAAGQRSIEHPRLFLLECYAAAAQFRALDDPLAAYTPELRELLVNQQNTERCQSLMSAMANSNTWWVPTLQVLQLGAYADDPAFKNDPRLMYVPVLYRELIWKPDLNRQAAASNQTGNKTGAALYALALAHVGQAHAAGVKLLVGTDAFDSYVFPGFALHEELAALVEAGLSPMGALRAATIDAARYSGVDSELGSIAPGKAADMLLLDADPLLDIRNTQQISGLFFNGRYYNRSALDDLLAFAAERAASIRTNARLFWNAMNSPLMRVQFAD